MFIDYMTNVTVGPNQQAYCNNASATPIFFVYDHK